MKEHFKNIKEAIERTRETDLIVEIISNKTAITKPQWVNGGTNELFYGEPTVFRLIRNKVYSYGVLSHFVKGATRVLNEMPNIENNSIFFHKQLNVHRAKHTDNRPYKKRLRISLREVKNYLDKF